MTRQIRLRLLGSFDADHEDGVKLELTGKKLQGLVSYLGVETGHHHSRSELASLLWGETGNQRARHNLRHALSKIRNLCPELLEVQDDTLSLSSRCWVDVREFERALDSDDPDELEAALALYRDDLLTGFSLSEEAFGDWLWDARARLRDRACVAFEVLAETLEESGRTEDAIELWRRRLSFDAACEPAHRSLMRLLTETGRRSDAVRQYQRCVDALDRELGVEPDRETTELLESIRATARSAEGREPIVSGVATEANVSGAVAEELPSVAVLAFERLSEEQNRYFADGVAEDIITSLSSFGSLLVIARESSFSFRNQEYGITEIGRRLGAQFIVRGSVQMSGNRLRLNVQLIEASSGRHLWAQHYDRLAEDLFSVQDEVVETVVSTLAGRVEAARLLRARRMPPESLGAYDCLIRGKDLHHRVTASDCERSIRMFEDAIERDRGFAMAHAWLGCGLGQAMKFRPTDREALLERAEQAALRARELDESEPECHRILFHVAVLRNDIPRARSHLERAINLNPNDDRIVCAMGNLCTIEGKPEEGESWVRKAMRLNPFHAEGLWFHLARALFQRGRDREALDALSRVTLPGVRELVYRAALYARLDQPQEARSALQKLEAMRTGFEPLRWATEVPFVRPRDRRALLDSLIKAGVSSDSDEAPDVLGRRPDLSRRPS